MNIQGGICVSVWAAHPAWMLGVPGRFWNEVLHEDSPKREGLDSKQEMGPLDSTCLRLNSSELVSPVCPVLK